MLIVLNIYHWTRGFSSIDPWVFICLCFNLYLTMIIHAIFSRKYFSNIFSIVFHGPIGHKSNRPLRSSIVHIITFPLLVLGNTVFIFFPLQPNAKYWRVYDRTYIDHGDFICASLMLDSVHQNDDSSHLILALAFRISFFQSFPHFKLCQTLDPKGYGTLVPRTFVCINLNIHITMILHGKYCKISIAGSWEEHCLNLL